MVAPADCILCSFLFGKSGLAPLKSVSILILELVATTLAAPVELMLRSELLTVISTSVFWTDSLAVLLRVKYSTISFPVFVGNKLA